MSEFKDPEPCTVCSMHNLQDDCWHSNEAAQLALALDAAYMNNSHGLGWIDSAEEIIGQIDGANGYRVTVMPFHKGIEHFCFLVNSCLVVSMWGEGDLEVIAKDIESINFVQKEE